MSNGNKAASRLEAALGPLPKTFQELGPMVEQNGSFSPDWRRNGVWAAEILSDGLGQDWMARFAQITGNAMPAWGAHGTHCRSAVTPSHPPRPSFGYGGDRLRPGGGGRARPWAQG